MIAHLLSNVLSNSDPLFLYCVQYYSWTNCLTVPPAQDSLKGLKMERLREHVQQIVWPSGQRVILLAEGRQLNHTCSCVPSLVVSVTHATQVQQHS